MPTKPFYVIPRYDAKHKEVILFLPTVEANRLAIVIYAHADQHGEASLDYYYSTKPVPSGEDEQKALRDLLNEYDQKLDKRIEHMELRKRDTFKFWRERSRNYVQASC